MVWSKVLLSQETTDKLRLLLRDAQSYEGGVIGAAIEAYKAAGFPDGIPEIHNGRRRTVHRYVQ